MATEKFTARQVIDAVKGSGGIISVVASRLKCDRRTVYNYRDRYATVREAIEEERNVFLDLAESAFIRLVEEGNLRAVLFGLSTLGKDRGYTTRVDIGAVVEHEIEDLLATLEKGLEKGEFEKILRVLRRRHAIGSGPFTFRFDLPPEEETA